MFIFLNLSICCKSFYNLIRVWIVMCSLWSSQADNCWLIVHKEWTQPSGGCAVLFSLSFFPLGSGPLAAHQPLLMTHSFIMKIIRYNRASTSGRRRKKEHKFNGKRCVRFSAFVASLFCERTPRSMLPMKFNWSDQFSGGAIKSLCLYCLRRNLKFSIFNRISFEAAPSSIWTICFLVRSHR